ncbi:MAG: hypothetical protein J7499_02540 [Sphingopyxis sp.]|nr:hypothetical protein [Sphingopyxis sp.]
MDILAIGGREADDEIASQQLGIQHVIGGCRVAAGRRSDRYDFAGFSF